MGHQKKSYKKFVATAATATLVASAIVPVASASFTDVAENNEFATNINAAVEAGYIKGYEDGTFGVNDNLKRSQVVIIIGRYLEKLGYTSEATTSPWSDVTDAEVIKYGNIVKDAGVFTGYADGTLNGAGFITRENMAVVLDRLAKTVTGTSLSDVAGDIEDIKVADLATANADYQGSIQALRDLGISTADNFNPKGNVKRGQFAKFIVTAVEKIDAIAPTAENIAKAIAAVDAKLPAVADIKAENAEAAKAAVEAAKKSIEAIKAKIEKAELTTEEKAELEKAITAVEAKYAAIVAAADKAIAAAKGLAVESVSVINTNTIKINFNKEVEDTKEIAAAGNRVVVYESRLVDATRSTSITFSADKKSAVVQYAGTPFTVGKAYNIALVDDATNLFASKELAKFNTVVIPAATGTGTVSKEAGDDRKFKITFSKSMGTDAINLAKYQLLDNNNNIIAADASTVLAGAATGTGNPTWENTTPQRTQFKFYVKTGTSIAAGQTYKLVAKADLVALDGTTAIKQNDTAATFTTPALTDVQPKLANAQVTSDTTIELTFNKAVKDRTPALPYIESLKENGVDITAKIQAAALANNKITITLTSGNKFASNKSYTVSLNSRVAQSADYANAYSAAVADQAVTFTKNEKPVLTSAAIVRDENDKTKADLKLVFDKPVLGKTSVAKEIKIETLGKTYELAASQVLTLDPADSTNKTLILKDIADGKKFGATFNSAAIIAAQDYKVTVAKGAVSVNTLAADKETNDEAYTTIKGVDIAAPVAKSITYVSASEIQVKFDETIDTASLKASDISIQGFFKETGSKYYAAKVLTGDDFLTFSVSGDTLTIKPKDSTRTLFQTGKVGTTDVVSIAANKIKDANGIKLATAVNETAVKAENVIDKAAPMMVAVKTITGQNEFLAVTYSEGLAAQAQNAVISNFVITGALGNDGAKPTLSAKISDGANAFNLYFTAGTVVGGAEYADATVQYVGGTTLVKDLAGNNANLQTITGIGK